MILVELLPGLSVVTRVWVCGAWDHRPQNKRVLNPHWGGFRLGDTEPLASDCTELPTPKAHFPIVHCRPLPPGSPNPLAQQPPGNSELLNS